MASGRGQYGPQTGAEAVVEVGDGRRTKKGREREVDRAAEWAQREEEREEKGGLRAGGSGRQGANEAR